MNQNASKPWRDDYPSMENIKYLAESDEININFVSSLSSLLLGR